MNVIDYAHWLVILVHSLRNQAKKPHRKDALSFGNLEAMNLCLRFSTIRSAGKLVKHFFDVTYYSYRMPSEPNKDSGEIVYHVWSW